jgi:four helix bundle protein
MTELSNTKQYDLEERSFLFAKNVRAIIKKLPKTISNIEDSKQLNNSSGSVGANYIEANESISKKDFVFRIKICRKESKESRYWLRLVDTEENIKLDEERKTFIKEAEELTKIFGAILEKCK